MDANFFIKIQRVKEFAQKLANMNNYIQHFSFVDALYYGAGMASTVLELAIIAIHPDFGAYGLEIVASMIIFFSIFLSYSSGMFFANNIGCNNTVILGYVLKTISVVALCLAIVVLKTSLFMSWTVLTIFIMLDTMASGCLISSFKPAYNNWCEHYTGNKIDFVLILTKMLWIRIGVPSVILCIGGLIFWIMNSSNYEKMVLYGTVFMLSAMFLIRIYQLYLSLNDLRWMLGNKLINNKSEDKMSNVQNDVCEDNKKNISTNMSENKNHNANEHKTPYIKTSIILYILGNVALFSVMSYFIGLLFKITNINNLPTYQTWLLSTCLSFLIYSISTILVCFYLPKINTKSFNQPKIRLNISILIIISLLNIYSFLYGALWVQIITLTAFCIDASIIGNSLQRIASNYIIQLNNNKIQVKLFMFCETFPDVVIACAGLMAVILHSNIVTPLLLFAIVLFGMVYALILSTKNVELRVS